MFGVDTVDPGWFSYRRHGNLPTGVSTCVSVTMLTCVSVTMFGVDTVDPGWFSYRRHGSRRWTCVSVTMFGVDTVDPGWFSYRRHGKVNMCVSHNVWGRTVDPGCLATGGTMLTCVSVTMFGVDTVDPGWFSYRRHGSRRWTCVSVTMLTCVSVTMFGVDTVDPGWFSYRRHGSRRWTCVSVTMLTCVSVTMFGVDTVDPGWFSYRRHGKVNMCVSHNVSGRTVDPGCLATGGTMLTCVSVTMFGVDTVDPGWFSYRRHGSRRWTCVSVTWFSLKCSLARLLTHLRITLSRLCFEDKCGRSVHHGSSFKRLLLSFFFFVCSACDRTACYGIVWVILNLLDCEDMSFFIYFI